MRSKGLHCKFVFYCSLSSMTATMVSSPLFVSFENLAPRLTIAGLPREYTVYLSASSQPLN